VDRLAAGGSGIAELTDHRVVFIDRAAPGDALRVAVDLALSPARGRILDIIKPGPDRIEPPCPVAHRCGGCDLMHLTIAAQERAHAAVVKSAIEHATGTTIPDVVVHQAPAPLGYRSRARLLVRAARGAIHAGYRAHKAHDVVDRDGCSVLDEALAGIFEQLRWVFAEARGEGDVQAALGIERRPVVDVAWRGELAASTWSRLNGIVAERRWAGARVVLEGAAAAASFGDPRVHTTGADGHPLLVGPGGFAQPSDAGAQLLARRVAELASKSASPKRILELFSGSGTLSVLLARDAASYIAVELDASAVASARENFASRGLSVKAVSGDANRAAIPPNTDLIVLDPPRSGAPEAAERIANSRAREVIYVSCDPATLARDLAPMTRAGLVLSNVETFELFPQTSHVETVVRLERVPRR